MPTSEGSSLNPIYGVPALSGQPAQNMLLVCNIFVGMEQASGNMVQFFTLFSSSRVNEFGKYNEFG